MKETQPPQTMRPREWDSWSGLPAGFTPPFELESWEFPKDSGACAWFAWFWEGKGSWGLTNVCLQQVFCGRKKILFVCIWLVFNMASSSPYSLLIGL